MFPEAKPLIDFFSEEQEKLIIARADQQKQNFQQHTNIGKKYNRYIF